jgi:hypothetical protein
MRTRLVKDTPTGGHARAGLSVVASELPRLTPRDRWLLNLLHEHRTFTTDQVAQLGFNSADRARKRLGVLLSRDVLDRFRHYVWPGSQSWRWTLAPLGAAIVAAARGESVPRPAAVRDAMARLATSPTLAHLIGVNGFFAALTGHAHTHDGYALSAWWSERQATRACGNLARPDGGGVWSHDGRAVPFWLEYDTGTERPISRVSDKLPGYASMAGTRTGYPVLFWLPTAVRESNLTAHLARTGIPPGVTVVTGAADHAAGNGGPAGAVWHVIGRGGRVRLGELPTPAPYRGNGDGAPWES